MRYKSVKFRDFSGGQGQKFLDNKSKFSKSVNVYYREDLDDIVIAPAYSSNSSYTGYISAIGLICEHDDYLYLAFADSSDDIKIYRSSDFTTWTLRATIAGLGAEFHSIFSAWGRLNIVFSGTGTGYFFDLRYSTDGGANWIIVDLPNLGTSKTQAPKLPIAFLNNSYYWQVQNILWESADGLTFTKVSEYDYTFYDLCSDGLFLYARAVIGSSNYLLRIYSDGSVEKLRNLGKNSFSLCEYNDGLAISQIRDGILYVYYFHDSILELIAKIDDYTFIDKIYLGNNFAFSRGVFICACEDQGSSVYVEHVYYLDLKGAVFHFSSLGSNRYVNIIVEFGDTFCIATSDSNFSNFVLYYFNLDQCQSYCEIETSIISPTTHSPIAIILRHDPLPGSVGDVGYIEVYCKKDGASSWGSVILTSNTLSSVKKEYRFPKGDEIETVQFKIKKIKNSSYLQPENVSLEYLYLPTGLSNSK